MELGSEKIVPGFRAGGSQDLQRTYNNVANGGGAEFVSAFTDIASFHLGFALRVAGFHPETTTAAGGFYNLRNLFEEDISVTWRWGINSDLPADIYAGADFYSTGRWAPEPIINPLRNTPTGLPCFSAGTPILLADGTSRAIEDIHPGDAVAAFDETDSLGRADLRPATVARLLPGVTEEWIVLEDTSSARLRQDTRVTPGHRYLTEHGTWATAAELIVSDVRAVAADGSLVPLRGTLLRASDAGSDAEWITPEPHADGGNLVQPAPVFGWRTYNFEVAELHTYVAAGMRVHNDCLHANETILQDSFELLPDGTGYSIAAINSITGLVTTINHTVAGNPVDGIITDIGDSLISRQTHIPSIDSFLNQELTFGDDNIIIPGGWSFQNNEFSHQFGDLPDGLVVVEGGPIDYPSDGVFGEMSDYDPIQDLGLAGLDESGEPWGATSFGDMNWYGLADPNDGSVVTTIGYHQPETPPPDPETGEAAPTPPAQVFIRQQETSGGSLSFNDAFIVGGETAFTGVGMTDGSYTGLTNPPPDDGIINDEGGDDTLPGGGGNDDLTPPEDSGPTLTTGRWRTSVSNGEEQGPPPPPTPPIITGAAIGRIFGSSLANLIDTDNVFEDIAVTAALQTGLGAVGATVDTLIGNGQIADISLVDASGNFQFNAGALGQSFATNLSVGAIGVVSGYLAGELSDAIGLDGDDFGAQLFNTTASTYINSAIKDVAGRLATAAELPQFGELISAPSNTVLPGIPADIGGLAGSLGVSIGALVGTRLAHQIVEIENVGGAIGSSIGSAIGTTVGVGVASALSLTGTLIGSVLLPGVGAFVGTILGTVIGNWFGNRWPDHGYGEARATIGVGNYGFARQYARGDDANFSTPNARREIAVRGILNKFIGASGGSAGSVVALKFRLSYYNSGKQSYVTVYGGGLDGVKKNSYNDTQIVNFAVVNAARRLNIRDGDRFISHALRTNNATTVDQLALQVTWASNWSNIASLLEAANPELTFALRTFRDAVGTQGDAVWRSARAFGYHLNETNNAARKEAVGVHVYRALTNTTANSVSRLQAQLSVAEAYTTTMNQVLALTGGVIRGGEPTPDFNAHGLQRLTNAQGQIIEGVAAYNTRLNERGGWLARQQLQSRLADMTGDPYVIAALADATTNDPERLIQNLTIARGYGGLIEMVLGYADDGVTIDMPSFRGIDLTIHTNPDVIERRIGEEVVEHVRRATRSLSNDAGVDPYVLHAAQNLDATSIANAATIITIAASFSENITNAAEGAEEPAMLGETRQLFANFGVTFNSFGMPDFNGDWIDINPSLSTAAQDAAYESQANAAVETLIVDAIRGGEFEGEGIVLDAVRQTTASSRSELISQLVVAQDYSGIVQAMSRLGIDTGSLALPDFNATSLETVPGEDATDAEREAYVDAIRSQSLAVLDSTTADVEIQGSETAVAEFTARRDTFIELALQTQALVAGALNILTTDDQIVIGDEIARVSTTRGSVLSVGAIDLASVDLSAINAAIGEGDRATEIANVAGQLAYQALRDAEIENGNPYEMRALTSPTVTDFQSLINELTIGSDLSFYSENRSAIDAVTFLDPDNALAGGWVLSVLKGLEINLHITDGQPFSEGLAPFLEQNASLYGSLGDLMVRQESGGLAVVETSGDHDVIALPDIAEEAGLVTVNADPAAPVTGTDGNDLWVASGDGGESFTDAAETADADGSHDVLLGGAGADTIDAGFGNDYVSGGAGADVITGGSGNDVIDGGAGNDILSGDAGNDTYLFREGSGQDIIRNNDTSLDSNDQIAFGSGISSEDVWFQRLDNDLTVSLLDADDQITVEGWFDDPADQVDEFVLGDGSELAASDVQQLISAMASFDPANFGAAGDGTTTPLPEEVRVAVNGAWQTAA
ncbi:MAG: hypothetical protein K0U74_14000 [Alphaproteobacteria bacterium]|nr:hypothetical protein [Alphaproteobacteria bacterium]